MIVSFRTHFIYYKVKKSYIDYKLKKEDPNYLLDKICHKKTIINGIENLIPFLKFPWMIKPIISPVNAE